MALVPVSLLLEQERLCDHLLPGGRVSRLELLVALGKASLRVVGDLLRVKVDWVVRIFERDHTYLLPVGQAVIHWQRNKARLKRLLGGVFIRL